METQPWVSVCSSLNKVIFSVKINFKVMLICICIWYMEWWLVDVTMDTWRVDTALDGWNVGAVVHGWPYAYTHKHDHESCLTTHAHTHPFLRVFQTPLPPSTTREPAIVAHVATSSAKHHRNTGEHWRPYNFLQAAATHHTHTLTTLTHWRL